MKLSELDQLLARRIAEADNPQVTNVRLVAAEGQPNNHTRLKVDFDDGSSAYVMVAEVTGPRINRHPRFELPKAVL